MSNKESSKNMIIKKVKEIDNQKPWINEKTRKIIEKYMPKDTECKELYNVKPTNYLFCKKL